MWPPGYFGAPATMPDGDNLARGGKTMGDAIQQTGGPNSIYETTTAVDFYPAAGACDDWMYDQIVQSPNPKAAIAKGLVYTIELCPAQDASDVCALNTYLF